MENAREDIPTLDSLDSPVVASGEVDADVAAVDVALEPDDEERRRQLHASFNNRVSHLCKLVALVIAIVAFATIALRQEMPQFVMMGLCLSVALLAIAMLQDHQKL